MKDTLLQSLAYNIMKEWRDNVLLGYEVDDTSGNLHTRKCLKHIKSVTGDLP